MRLPEYTPDQIFGSGAEDLHQHICWRVSRAVRVVDGQGLPDNCNNRARIIKTHLVSIRP